MASERNGATCLNEAVHNELVGPVGDEEAELLVGDLRVLRTRQSGHGTRLYKYEYEHRGVDADFNCGLVGGGMRLV